MKVSRRRSAFFTPSRSQRVRKTSTVNRYESPIRWTPIVVVVAPHFFGAGSATTFRPRS